MHCYGEPYVKHYIQSIIIESQEETFCHLP